MRKLGLGIYLSVAALYALRPYSLKVTALNLAIFDLDNTLLGGDSDYLWGRFLIEQGIVDGVWYERENRRYYAEYQAGTLNMVEFLTFALAPLAAHDMPTLLHWREQFLRDKILPIILPAARKLLRKHREQAHTLMIITATNLFVTEPIATEFGVDHLLATTPEQADGRYTGRVTGDPCFREGKVANLNQWLAKRGVSLTSSWFYSDSHNDLPLLEIVTHPIAVDPDPTLTAHALNKGWPIISLR